MNSEEQRKNAVPLAGVLGWPITYSLSPLIHGAWLKALGLKGQYVPLGIAPEDLAQCVAALPLAGFRGFNVTSPHKEAVMASLDHITARARRIGAVNTIWADGGALHGDCTDGEGFVSALPDDFIAKLERHGGETVVLGAGGAARAIIDALAVTKGVRAITILNRTAARAVDLAAEMQAYFADVNITGAALSRDPDCFQNATLLVNTSSAGMGGHAGLDVDVAGLPGHAIVYDIIYVPAKTPLLEAAEARGLVAINGLSMLIEQAKPGFARWFGMAPPEAVDIHALLTDALTA